MKENREWSIQDKRSIQWPRKSISLHKGKSPTREAMHLLKTETKDLRLDASHIPLWRDGFGFRNAQRFYQSIKIRQAFSLLSRY
jgi:hypothetical protein